MYLKVNGQNIYFQTLGQGPDLILLHGWMNDVSSFWGITEDLKADFTLWLIDLPGFGRSDKPKKPFKVIDYAEIIREFCSMQKLRQPMLLGHSVGGRIGIKLAATYPDQLSKLILEDAAGIKPKQDYTKPLFYLIAKMAKLVVPNWWNLKQRLRYRFYKSVASDYLTAGAMAQTLTNLLAEDLSPELKKITIPTLVISGAQDQTRGASVADSQQLYRQIAQAKLAIIAKAGHHPHLQNPSQFLYYLKDYLSD